MFLEIKKYLIKPKLFAKSTSVFWKDGYISKSTLKSHLDKEYDLATRKMEFVEKSAYWIAQQVEDTGTHLLDLGCGPGIYAELFHNYGFKVVGLDFSKRSIDYAKKEAKQKKLPLKYYYQNYLKMVYEEKFNIVTMIYCDFGVLTGENRKIILEKIYRSLKKGGKFIFDVFSLNQHKGKKENTSWQYEEAGFWSIKPNLCLNSFYRYDDDNTVLNQTVVISKQKVECYNIWEHCFTKEELKDALKSAGFTKIEFYNNLIGEKYSKANNTIGIVATK